MALEAGPQANGSASMSTAKLNVWITEFADPCHIMSDHKDPQLPSGPVYSWYVHIVDCHGQPLVWCDEHDKPKTFTFLPAKCGHLEVEIPPGCYAVFAGHSPNPSGRPPFGNRLTHVQVVRANCGDHVCVTLFSPELWFCGSWFQHALERELTPNATQVGLVAEKPGGVDPKLVKN